MTSVTRSAGEVAHGLLLDLEAAKCALHQLESLLFFASTGKEHPAHACNLIETAWNLAADAANTISCNYESASGELDDLAPRSAKSESVSQESGVSK